MRTWLETRSISFQPIGLERSPLAILRTAHAKTRSIRSGTRRVRNVRLSLKITAVIGWSCSRRRGGLALPCVALLRLLIELKNLSESSGQAGAPPPPESPTQAQATHCDRAIAPRHPVLAGTQSINFGLKGLGRRFMRLPLHWERTPELCSHSGPKDSRLGLNRLMHHPGDSSMSRRKLCGSHRHRSKTLHHSRPRLENLESRALLRRHRGSPDVCFGPLRRGQRPRRRVHACPTADSLRIR